MRRVREGRRRDAGSTSVEFALVLPVFITLIGGVLVFGLAMVYAGLADHAARVGLRTAAIRNTGVYPDASRVCQVIDSKLAGLLPTPENCAGDLLTRPDGPVGHQGDRVRVRVVYVVPAVSQALSFIPNATLRAAMTDLVTVSRVAEGRLE